MRIMEPDGLKTIPSSYSAKETMDRVAAAVEKRGMTISARVDHAAAAAAAGLKMQPTEVLIFGNPKAGTPLMQAAPTLGIDLPLKILVWDDAAGSTHLSYNDPQWLANRHAVPAAATSTLAAMTAAVDAVAKEATGKGS
jgi:uncharacterized protein (DUF302 family)